MTNHEVNVASAVEGSVEHHPVMDALLLAFATDASVRYLFPTATSYLANFRRLAAAMAGRAVTSGTAWTAGGGATALWLAPGRSPDAEALGALVFETAPPERLGVLAEFGQLMDQYHPKEPHWYLPLIGVDPSRQGQGLGAALLKEGLRRCDADGLPAYLESSSPRNVPLYERHGFEVTGLIKPGDHPGVIPMYRPARRT